MARILVIDDDEEFLNIMNLLLTNAGYEVKTVSRSEGVMEEIEETEPDLVITDIMMPGISGSMVYEQIRRDLGPSIPIIVCTGTTLKVHTKDDSLIRTCRKPVDCNELKQIVTFLLERANNLKTKT